MGKLQGWKRRGSADDVRVTGDGSAPGAAPETTPGTAPGTAPGTTVLVAPEPSADPTTLQAPDGEPTEPTARRTTRLQQSVASSDPVLLAQAAHPRQALVTALGLGVAALVSGRPLREAAVVAATGLVGQTILGWHNDIVDRTADARHQTPHKPLADGRLDVGNVWYALVLAVLLVIPLSISTGVDAGTFFLGSLAVGLLGNVALRRGRFSLLSWAAQFALFTPYLALGGWGGGAHDRAPEAAMVVLFALLGVGVHFLRAIWGLVADDADQWTYLPLVVGRKLGATRLLVVSATWIGLVLVAMTVVGATVGLRR